MWEKAPAVYLVHLYISPVDLVGVLSSLEAEIFLGAGTGGDLGLEEGGEEVPEIPESLPAP